jgi:hypothetical protein
MGEVPGVSADLVSSIGIVLAKSGVDAYTGLAQNSIATSNIVILLGHAYQRKLLAALCTLFAWFTVLYNLYVYIK